MILHKVKSNKLPSYFTLYKSFLNKKEKKYNPLPNPLPVPAVNHEYAESSLIYGIVNLKNDISNHYLLQYNLTNMVGHLCHKSLFYA